MTFEVNADICWRILDMDPDKGLLFWKARDRSLFANAICSASWNTKFAGKEAFTTILNNGYRCGSVFGRKFTAHRLIYLMHTGQWPQGQIDHINGIRTDNRIVNLRDVTPSVNGRNKCISSNNSTGVTGVYWQKAAQKWTAEIKVNSVKTYLGLFETFDDAAQARKEAEIAMGFHKNHGRAA